MLTKRQQKIVDDHLDLLTNLNKKCLHYLKKATPMLDKVSEERENKFLLKLLNYRLVFTPDAQSLGD